MNWVADIEEVEEMLRNKEFEQVVETYRYVLYNLTGRDKYESFPGSEERYAALLRSSWRTGEPPEGTNWVLIWKVKVGCYEFSERDKWDATGLWKTGNEEDPAGPWNPDWYWMPLPPPPVKKG
jgi:hypothetical protein